MALYESVNIWYVCFNKKKNVCRYLIEKKKNLRTKLKYWRQSRVLNRDKKKLKYWIEEIHVLNWILKLNSSTKLGQKNKNLNVRLNIEDKFKYLTGRKLEYKSRYWRQI